ncbi:predicted coding region HI0101 [Haemophilus influenzae Rd KW20]|uniref:Uncharacterized protein HI_0101 n=1 Tax=Haemophilus influenzae (strain ATCC 51907 / DSM 11121 / KW20 / Rd) TaxID=71421 RepID=Y101_HAEIN|nr:RecName: Full=Uncharacterized protein HI_0101 [Haemophilus influenzae Rd KW20]AAC21782.1 predicted coding region HI0101 [Haemophilus influenzae Rd KW20]
MKLTPEMLTGKSREHLVNLPTTHSSNHFLQTQAVQAFQALQQSAAKNGFNLQPASSFRDFERQQLIWNSKFKGERKVHDDAGKALDLNQLDDWQKCQAILRWSALLRLVVIIGERKWIFLILIFCHEVNLYNWSLGNMKKAATSLN